MEEGGGETTGTLKVVVGTLAFTLRECHGLTEALTGPSHCWVENKLQSPGETGEEAIAVMG